MPLTSAHPIIAAAELPDPAVLFEAFLANKIICHGAHNTTNLTLSYLALFISCEPRSATMLATKDKRLET
jgi:hypothetical protein